MGLEAAGPKNSTQLDLADRSKEIGVLQQNR